MLGDFPSRWCDHLSFLRTKINSCVLWQNDKARSMVFIDVTQPECVCVCLCECVSQCRNLTCSTDQMDLPVFFLLIMLFSPTKSLLTWVNMEDLDSAPLQIIFILISTAATSFIYLCRKSAEQLIWKPSWTLQCRYQNKASRLHWGAQEPNPNGML